MAIAHVISTSAAGADSATVTTSAVDTTGANLIVLAVARYQGGTGVTVSDSKGNTWTALTDHPTATDPAIRLYYCLAPTVGSGHTFQMSGTGVYPSVSMSAFSGASAYDSQQNGNASDSSATSGQPGSITPSENNCVAVTGAVTNGTSLVVDGDYSAHATVSSPGAGYTSGIAYSIQTTAAATNPTWSWTGGSSHAEAIASFRATAGGSVFTPYFYRTHVARQP
jgi:hypothetical protein